MMLPSRSPAGERHEEAIRFAGVICRGCTETRSEGELDKNGFCTDCQELVERGLGMGPHVVASVITLPFAIWVVLAEKTAVLPWYAWLLPLAAAYSLGLRIGREALKGYNRWKRIRAP